jgi:hypothetical protein
MKKWSIFLVLALAVATGCYKDLGNYSYHGFNQLVINNFDTVKGYTVDFNDTLKVSPTISNTTTNAPAANYTYQWSVRIFNGVEDSVDHVIAVTPALSIVDTLTPGNYILTFRVTDNSTGLTYQAKAPLMVSSQVYEGFFVLNGTGGGTPRLDMLSYNSSTASFVQYTDVLKLEGSPLTLQGTPYQVFCGYYTNSNINTQNYGIWLLTSSLCTRVNQETLGWDQTYTIASNTAGDVPADFAPQRISASVAEPFPAYYQINLFLWNSGDIYNDPVMEGQYAFSYSPRNAYVAGATPFPTSPFVVTNGQYTVAYDTQALQFADLTTTYTTTTFVPSPANDSLPTGKDLVYMEYNASGNCYAVLKDATPNPVYYLLRWPIGGAKAYYKPIQGTGIANATCFAVSPQLGYLFYSVGGQVYEYDPSLLTSKLMLDEGSNTVSYLAFNNFFNRSTNTTYASWNNDLLVGASDAGSANGTLGLYTVPSVNGQIQPLYQWTGFGKIVSVSYRER